MNCFQLIKTVLDEAWEEMAGSTDERIAAVQTALRGLQKEYATLESKGCLDYSDAARRFAYLLKYTTSHANLVYKRLMAAPTLRDLFDHPSLEVACIGGGPGSDFLGVLKVWERVKSEAEVTCLLLDRDPAWGESWLDVAKKLGYRGLSTVFHPLDVTKPNSWMPYKKYYKYNLFTLSYFVSEVYAQRDTATKYFETLLSSIQSGGAVLYIDNNSPSFSDWFDGMVTAQNFDTIESDSGTEQMSLDEDKSDLGEHYDRFKNVKLNANVAWRVLVKR